MKATALSFRDLSLAGLTEARHDVQQWWNDLPEAVRSPAWPRALALLTALYLLLAFHQVVAQSVRQGEVLRMATANHAEAVWRCNAMRGVRLKQSCLDPLNKPPSAAVALPENTVVTTRVAQLAR